jgi:hypothetical protein
LTHYFDKIEDVKIAKDMLDLAEHITRAHCSILSTKSAPEKRLLTSRDRAARTWLI